MPELFPVFVGITGKREFSENRQIAKELEQQVRGRLSQAFTYIEGQLPDALKILLTGAAVGADLIAAEEVLFSQAVDGLPRKNWLVVAVLPFAENLFQQDFRPDEWERFRRVADNTRTLVWTLPPLRVGKDGKPFDAADLERGSELTEFQKDIRRRHYEQVGLWIADQADVLIGVMSASEPADKVGGTGRIT